MIRFGFHTARAAFGFEPVLLYAGSRVTETVPAGAIHVLVAVAGEISVRTGVGQILRAGPREPIVLRSGEYTVTARSRVLLVKGARCKTTT